MNTTLLNIGKRLEKNPVRNYAGTICIKDNKATITNGFALMQWLPEYDIGEDRILKPDLSESSVSYPNYDAVIPNFKEADRIKDCWALGYLFEALRGIKQTSAAMHLWLKVETQMEVPFFFVPACKQKSQAFPHLPTFNVSLLTQYLKGINLRTITPISAHCNGEILQLVFKSEGETYKIILVAIKVK